MHAEREGNPHEQQFWHGQLLPSSQRRCCNFWMAADQRAGVRPALRRGALRPAAHRLVLHEWQQSRLIDTAELVACELVTNAIAATRASDCLCPVRLRLASDGSRALILVSDSSPDPPRRINAVCDTESGRGLLLVEALSNSWGWYATREHGTTKTVWAELREGGQHEPSDS